MSPWQEYKKKLGTTRPWDMFNPNIEYVPEAEASTRMAICEECPSLLRLTHQCKECGCFMKMKTKIKTAECPLGKW
jgi:hypothetical protein